jgi:hypothetical protein
MKVSVACAVYYNYSLEVLDGIDQSDLLSECDCNDPVFEDICRLLDKKRIAHDAEITSIINEKTDDLLYTL